MRINYNQLTFLVEDNFKIDLDINLDESSPLDFAIFITIFSVLQCNEKGP